jgi:RND family efflux transporter MFP subunit
MSARGQEMARGLALVFAVAVAACASAGAGGCGRAGVEAESKAEPIAVHCAPPSAQPIEETIALRGRTEPPPGGDLPVASQVPGRVVSVAVKEGQRIAAGELVASVDDAPSRDALHQAEATVALARAGEVNAELTLKRTQELVQRGIAARQELDDAVARAETAKANAAAAAASADLARRTLGRVSVRSPLGGVVTRVWRGSGALVDGSAATPIIQLAAVQGAEFVADATQRELARIEPGQAVSGVLAIGDAPIAGSIRTRASALDPTTGLGQVRVSLTSAPDVPVGTYGRVVVTTARRDARLVIPRTAIRGAISDGVEVAVCKDGKAHIKAVKTGWSDDARVEITSGLEAGDAVATDHVLGLDEDTPIKLSP